MKVFKIFTPAQLLLLGLIIINLLSWCWAFLVFKDSTFLMGMAILAYSFGLRHAVDADHIVAIDNVTRKLMQQGKKTNRRRNLLFFRSFHYRDTRISRDCGNCDDLF